ncbi:hypothetical protein CFOL_v3_03451, partial [Cephalotus follicularis]
YTITSSSSLHFLPLFLLPFCTPPSLSSLPNSLSDCQHHHHASWMNHIVYSCNVNESDRDGLRHAPMNCKYGKLTIVCIVGKSDKNKHKLYFFSDDKVCGGFLGWCLPIYVTNVSNDVVASPMTRDHELEEMTHVRREIQMLREAHKKCYRKLKQGQDSEFGIIRSLMFVMSMVIAIMLALMVKKL